MTFEHYLEEDLKNTYEYEDERILSNLYLTSLPMSMRELASRDERVSQERNEARKKKLQNEYLEDVEKQKWLLKDCEEICEVKTVSLDQLKNRIDPQKKSCDAYFYNPNEEENKRNILIEFKNVNKDKMLEYIKDDSKDGLWCKVIDSAALLTESIEFDGYSPEELIANTHLMIVYGEKANTVSEMHMNLPGRNAVKRDKNGRQKKAVPFDRQKNKEYSKKETDEILDRFAQKIKGKQFASCPKGYFGVPIKEPDEYKSGRERGHWYTLYSKKDFQNVVRDKRFFENWNWGVYQKYFQV